MAIMNPAMQARSAPRMTAPPDNWRRARIRLERSGSLYRGVGFWSTRTAMGRRGVAGFMRSIAARAAAARAMIQMARTAAPDAVMEIKDNGNINSVMNNDSVPLPPSDASAANRRLLVAVPMVTISWLLLVLVLVFSAVRIQRWELAPGEAMPVSSRIEFAAVKGGDEPVRYRASNAIRFVTAFTGQVSILDAVIGWIDPHVKIETYEEHFGSRTPGTSRRLGYQAMVGAKQIAEYVAASKLGLNPMLKNGRVLIEELVCDGAPAKGSACALLDVGQTITHVDGVPTPTLVELARELTGRNIGDKVVLTVLPYDQNGTKPDPSLAVKKTITLMPSPDQQGRAIIGIVPADTRTVSLPFEVKISTTDIGGPSAGLAFTLALLDELTKGNLMGNGGVVATGTINEDGTVGAIGALEQKAVAVRNAGATLFLVPAGQTDEEIAVARAAAGKKVKIVRVATVDEALRALRAHGGDPLVPSSAS